MPPSADFTQMVVGLRVIAPRKLGVGTKA